MSGEAGDSLRKRAQNEATCFALNDFLKQVEAERDQLKAENERLKLRLWDLEHSEVDHVLRERDTLRKQIDEARHLLSVVSCFVPGRHEAHIDAWLETIK